MTPFDPAALVAMLLAFYPAVSVAALVRARRERPEYFAAGELFGTHGEKLRLPDGRIFDLIFDVDGPRRRWQAVDVTGEVPGGSESFPLEPGPLEPIDVETVLPPPLEPVFAALVAGYLGDVQRAAGAIGVAAGDIVAAGNGEDVDGFYGESAGAGEYALEGHLRGFVDLDPSDVIRNTGGLTGVIDDARDDYPDPETTAPPNINVEPGPRVPPPNEGPGSPWYQQ